MKRPLTAIAAALVLSAAASAHIVLADPEAEAGSYYAGAFRVGHGCDGKATTSVEIEIPDGILTARPRPKPGWTIAVKTAPLAEPVAAEGGRQITERTVSIAWSGELSPDQFDEFEILMKLPAGEGPIYFPVVQTCGGDAVAWTDIPAAGQAWHDVPHPAPVLTLIAPAGHDGHAGHGP